MPHPSSLRLLVLHGLRVKHIAEPDAVASIFGLDHGEVEAELEASEGLGFVQRRDGQLSGWRLSPAGRVEHDRLVAEELVLAGARPALHEVYGSFLEINPELLRVCTAWQLRDGVVNDHLDTDYDAEVVVRLAELHGRSEPVTDGLVAALDRFRGYPTRLRHAVDRIRRGETEWFTRPLFDSYHTVWFELHEDLLSTLGVERGAETTRSA